MEPSLQDLIARLDQLSDGFIELRDGVRKAVLVSDLDPEMALTRARKVLEYVVRDVFERRVKEPPGTRPLENLLQRLVKDGHFPERLNAFANTIRMLGNVGTHHFGEQISVGDVYQSLAQLMPILQWYFEVERPDSGVRLDLPREFEPRESGARTQERVQSSKPRTAVVPQGLRSYTATDSDFFLQLLPGPRDQDGLPESLRFWKYRIEETQEPAFTVGVIYGPSGCGKSSLMKAGLLPRLAKNIIPVYVEATADETEARILAGLKKRLTALPADLDLTQTLSALRQGQGLKPEQKVFLVLDQFEQWLHARRGEANTALAGALRQCDGERVQCVLMVRDDFWMGLTRFLGDLQVELIQGRNAAAVDLFDLIHARKVLNAFGTAFGRLPDDPATLTRDQEMFLDQAVAGLAQDGRVISIRLALFAEMIKGKPWTPATLKDAGGMEGVGVTFLEETFRSTALRAHQKAAQAVLKALLPERGTDIKGHMRAYEELREAAGVSSRPGEFDDLLRILDREVRLITPTDPEGFDAEEGKRPAPANPGGQYYQLTHDYLVPSLREWLTRKQRETRRGRAELRLAERAALWNARPENRFLPSAWEWCRIQVLTKAKDWTGPQRRMMKRAERVHGFRTLGLLVVLAGLVGSGLAIRRRVIDDQNATYAAGLVRQLFDVETPSVPLLIAAMKDYRRWVDPALREQLPHLAPGSHPQLHASLALLPVDGGEAELLSRRLLGASPTELPVIWELLQEHHHAPVKRLWTVLEDPQADPDQRFRAACAVANSEAGGTTQRWDAVSRLVTDRLLASVLKNPSHYGPLIQSLRPVHQRLIAPLAQTFRDPNKPESERSLATGILADFARDQPPVLADLLMDAAPEPFAILWPKVQARSAQAMVALESELSQAAGSDHEQRSQRQARAAVALVRLGHAENVWPLLRHSRDPSVRSYLIHWLKPLGTDPRALVAKLEGLTLDPALPPAEGPSRMDTILFDPKTSTRRALVLALGEYDDPKDLSAGDREPLVAMLLEAYRNDPDAGIHGAAEWTLRRWKQEEALATVALPKLEDRGDRRWHVNSAGQTLVVIEGPVKFAMGSPTNEPGRFDDETPHDQRINRGFAIATKEVTREQYERFSKSDPKNRSYDMGDVSSNSPERQGPQVGVSWYDAAAYCNWLSAQEGLEACYEPNEKGEYAPGMKITADFRHRSGYRLPTEAEWEYVCRAGAVTSRYYGGTQDLLGESAWYLQNSPTSKASPCGRLKPNELGLFDLLGNAYEWCLDQNRSYSPDEGKDGDELINISSNLTNDDPRLLRGGAFANHAANVRAAYRNRNQPSDRGINSGFRLARTYP